MRISNFTRSIAAASLLLVAGCSNEPGQINDVHTGVTGYHSKMYEVKPGLLASLSVGAVIGVKGGETRYGLVTRHLSTGLGWSFFDEAWSFGTQLPYEVVGREVLGCGGGCSLLESGSIKLTEAQFRQAAVSGLEFKLAGKNRSVVAKAPPEAFREALAQARR